MNNLNNYSSANQKNDNFFQQQDKTAIKENFISTHENESIIKKFKELTLQNYNNSNDLHTHKNSHEKSLILDNSQINIYNNHKIIPNKFNDFNLTQITNINNTNKQQIKNISVKNNSIIINNNNLYNNSQENIIKSNFITNINNNINNNTNINNLNKSIIKDLTKKNSIIQSSKISKNAYTSTPKTDLKCKLENKISKIERIEKPADKNSKDKKESSNYNKIVIMSNNFNPSNLKDRVFLTKQNTTKNSRKTSTEKNSNKILSFYTNTMNMMKKSTLKNTLLTHTNNLEQNLNHNNQLINQNAFSHTVNQKKSNTPIEPNNTNISMNFHNYNNSIHQKLDYSSVNTDENKNEKNKFTNNINDIDINVDKEKIIAITTSAEKRTSLEEKIFKIEEKYKKNSITQQSEINIAKNSNFEPSAYINVQKDETEQPKNLIQNKINYNNNNINNNLRYYNLDKNFLNASTDLKANKYNLLNNQNNILLNQLKNNKIELNNVNMINKKKSTLPISVPITNKTSKNNSKNNSKSTSRVDDKAESKRFKLIESEIKKINMNIYNNLKENKKKLSSGNSPINNEFLFKKELLFNSNNLKNNINKNNIIVTSKNNDSSIEKSKQLNSLKLNLSNLKNSSVVNSKGNSAKDILNKQIKYAPKTEIRNNYNQNNLTEEKSKDIQENSQISEHSTFRESNYYRKEAEKISNFIKLCKFNFFIYQVIWKNPNIPKLHTNSINSEG